MKKKEIIKKSNEITEILNKRHSTKNMYLSIFYNSNNSINKYCISIPKKTGNAVIRNRIKRQLKSIIDQNKINIPNGYDYVIIVKRSILDLTYESIKDNLISLIIKIDGGKSEKNKNN